jgi:predicted nucleic acid-binding protein
MAFVLDASVTACWAFDDEDHPDATAAFDRIRVEEAVVPVLWWFEIRNILLVSERRGRISSSDTATFLGALSVLRIREDRADGDDGVFRLARAHKLSIYDAAYLELAQRENLALATLDGALRSAAEAEKVALVSPME